ncbi:MAG: TIGR03915 family putative DNA repair protein [Clostridiales bacterium]|nr:TIGR03915 family putative DNA repair protein [Clostridiales bacterium]
MYNESDIIYVYDGTFSGLMSCVFESFKRREMPYDIVSEDEYEMSLYETIHVETNEQKAKRVISGIKTSISLRAYFLISDGFLTNLKNKELYILKFIYMGFCEGKKVTAMLGDDTVSTLNKAVNHLGMECNHMLGFIRFSVYDDAMVSVIEPDNFVLPKIALHFVDRYPNENFIIYDKRHRYALISQKGNYQIIPVEEFREPEATDDEYAYRTMWKMFYDTIEIKERANPKCMMSHMPKHYWAHMTEKQVEPVRTLNA